MAETFGKTDKGPTWGYSENNRIKGTHFQSGSAGLLESITTWVEYQSENSKIKCAIYDENLDLVEDAVTEEKQIDSEQDGWLAFDFPTSPSVAAATKYWLVFFQDYSWSCYYATGPANKGLWQAVTYNNFPATLVPGGYFTCEYSIYATYSEAPPAKKTLVQAVLISIPALIVLPTLGQILKVTGGC